MAFNTKKALTYINIADELSKQVVEDIGAKLMDLVEADDDSRSEWLEDQDEWLKLAGQVKELKTFPWDGASNIKYPLMTLAAVQFHARAFPALVDVNQPVKCRVLGKDPDGTKLKRGERVAKYMSYQILEEMTEWLDEMDRTLFVLPIVGLLFKKTFYSDTLSRIKSIALLPRDLIVNYNATDYCRARMSHRIYMDKNEIKELQNKKIFLDVEFHNGYDDSDSSLLKLRDEVIGLTNSALDSEDSCEIIESHCWLDLDEDGYKEPYIVTFHRSSGTVLRIVARWSEEGFITNDKGKVVQITADEFFTPYVFLPDPNSSIYGIGFGRLLGPTNETVNTIINQLIDAGTLSNLQSGFIARGLKLKGGSTRFRPGEWKIVNTTGDDLRNGIFPMPVRDPSSTLFQLLGMLIEAGQQISSVTDVMMGENPGQNQPAQTTMAVLEQGQKVFTGIYRRQLRALSNEYKKIYNLDRKYLNEDLYISVLDEETELDPALAEQMDPQQFQQLQQQMAQNAPSIQDFEEDNIDILPTADPTSVSDAQKVAKATSLVEKAMAGLPVNLEVATRRALQAEGHEDIDELMQQPEPPPDLEQMRFQLETVQTQIKAFEAYYNAIEKVAKAEAAEAGHQLDQYTAAVDTHAQMLDAHQGQQELDQGQQELDQPQAPAQ